jgi:hypothetical protein
MVFYPMKHDESHIPIAHKHLAKDVDAVICVVPEYIICLRPRHIPRSVVINESPFSQ